MGDERRANPRFECDLLAELEVEGTAHAGSSADLSVGGISLRVPIALSVGAEVRVLLTIGHGWTQRDFLCLPATVVRCAEDDGAYLVGARFHPLDPIEDAHASRQLDLLIRILRGDLNRELATYRAGEKT